MKFVIMITDTTFMFNIKSIKSVMTPANLVWDTISGINRNLRYKEAVQLMHRPTLLRTDVSAADVIADMLSGK